ncbi:hypothetical protein RIR_jg23316.t1 [Rhizophagus irregularis DAOM 181602=DAOM 197198]|nr:hypothetical protein RIR_jg23316.t1 [Rhizophagus irregularis DAOM 181602=DAOM 197198]
MLKLGVLTGLLTFLKRPNNLVLVYSRLPFRLHLPKIGSMSSKAHIYNTTCTDLHETHSREKKTSSVSFVLRI